MSRSSPWISVGELEAAFAPEANALPPTRELVGRSVRLSFENGWTIECRFESGARLFWKRLDPTPVGTPREESYAATRIRDGIFFVDYVVRSQEATAISLVLDLNRGIATAVIGRLPDESEARQSLLERVGAGKELTAVAAIFLSGVIDRGFTAESPRHPPTDDLVGRRVEYAYSPTECYEHVYLNESFYSWHCLRGSERGLADTDRCHYYKLDEDLYLFVWREKIIPTLGVVVVDFRGMKTTGKIFGYEGGEFGKLSNFPIGAHVRLLNVTPREPPAAPS